MTNKKRLLDSLSIRLAKARRQSESSRALRILGPRGAATVLLGAALSIGGLSEALDGVHFHVEKDLEAVRIVREKQDAAPRVVAKLKDGFAANSVFKLSQALPDRYVSRELALFDSEWIPDLPTLDEVSAPHNKPRDPFREEMARINERIRREFFASAMPYGDLIHEKAEKYDVDPALVAAVIEAESRFRSNARSPVGAKGLMQLMPRTGRWMGARDLYNAEQNIDAGVKYIKYLQVRFDGNLKKTIAAYNAGEGNVRRYRGVPPFRETQTYVRRVMNNYDKRTRQLKEFSDERAGGGPSAEQDGMLTLR